MDDFAKLFVKWNASRLDIGVTRCVSGGMATVRTAFVVENRVGGSLRVRVPTSYTRNG